MRTAYRVHKQAVADAQWNKLSREFHWKNSNVKLKHALVGNEQQRNLPLHNTRSVLQNKAKVKFEPMMPKSSLIESKRKLMKHEKTDYSIYNMLVADRSI